MAAQFIIDITEGFLYPVFGSGLLLTMFLFGVVIMVLLAMRVNIMAILMVIIPLALAFTVGQRLTNMVTFEPWIFYVLMLYIGLGLAVVVVINFFK